MTEKYKKGIAIVEIPDCCYHCKFCITYEKDIKDCYLCHKKFTKEDIFKRQMWCPIKPIPERENEFEKLSDYDRGWRVGFNYFIDEILGDEIDKHVGVWYEDTDKRKPDEEMTYLKFNDFNGEREQYVWRDDMWVKIK